MKVAGGDRNPWEKGLHLSSPGRGAGDAELSKRLLRPFEAGVTNPIASTGSGRLGRPSPVATFRGPSGGQDRGPFIRSRRNPALAVMHPAGAIWHTLRLTEWLLLGTIVVELWQIVPRTGDVWA